MCRNFCASFQIPNTCKKCSHSPGLDELPQPPAPTTQVSELTVLIITSIHFRGLSVPTPIVIVDQVPSTPYLNIYQHIFFLEVMPTYQLSDGAICNADGELLTNCTQNSNAPAAKIRHHDAECIVRDSDAFYGCHRTLLKSRLLRCKEGIFIPRIVPLTRRLGRCRNAAVMYRPVLSARRALDDPVWTRGSLRTVVEPPVEFSAAIFFSTTIRTCRPGVWQLQITCLPLLDWRRRVWQDKL